MKGFIQRLALLIHWVGFLALGYIPFLIIAAIYLLITDPSFSVSFSAELLVGFAAPPGIAFFFWVLKWLISGNKSIFPWKS
tara:strand:- start:44 stop:286 length:243 start_codon:yes stop_codon:yes gene_type:complete